MVEPISPWFTRRSVAPGVQPESGNPLLLTHPVVFARAGGAHSADVVAAAVGTTGPVMAVASGSGAVALVAAEGVSAIATVVAVLDAGVREATGATEVGVPAAATGAAVLVSDPACEVFAGACVGAIPACWVHPTSPKPIAETTSVRITRVATPPLDHLRNIRLYNLIRELRSRAGHSDYCVERERAGDPQCPRERDRGGGKAAAMCAVTRGVWSTTPSSGSGPSAHVHCGSRR